MMGPHHAACGAAAWLAIATEPVVNLPGDVKIFGMDQLTLGLGLIPNMTPIQALVTTLFAAGAALLPDIDHHSSSITRSLPPITNILSRIFSSTGGGHRHGTHTIMGTLLFTALAFLASLFVVDLPEPIGTFSAGTFIFSVLLIALFLVTFKVVSGGKLGPWLVSLSLSAVISLNTPDSWYWLPLSVFVGSVAHIAGDFLTTGGIPLFKTYFMGRVILDFTPREGNYLGIQIKKNGFVSFPILGNTSSGREWALATVIGGYALVAFGSVLVTFIQEMSSNII